MTEVSGDEEDKEIQEKPLPSAAEAMTIYMNFDGTWKVRII